AGLLPNSELPVLAQPERIKLAETIKQIAVRLAVIIIFFKHPEVKKYVHASHYLPSAHAV
ncbi:MAG: hypothetical protein ACRC8Q_12380, partial [Aeromonas sp.]